MHRDFFAAGYFGDKVFRPRPPFQTPERPGDPAPTPEGRSRPRRSERAGLRCAAPARGGGAGRRARDPPGPPASRRGIRLLPRRSPSPPAVSRRSERRECPRTGPGLLPARGGSAASIPDSVPLAWAGAADGTGRGPRRAGQGGFLPSGARGRRCPGAVPVGALGGFPPLPGSRCPFLPPPDHVQVPEEDRGGEQGEEPARGGHVRPRHLQHAGRARPVYAVSHHTAGSESQQAYNMNRLNTLPRGFGSLPALEVLDLTYNNLNENSLPGNFFYLTTLRALYLSDNDFEMLPPDIGKLTKLQILSLRDNDLVSLPKEIGELTQLKELHIQGNRLTVLPPELGNLDLTGQKQVFKAENNPWVTPIADQFQLGVSHVFEYIRSETYKYLYGRHMQANPEPPKKNNDKSKKISRKPLAAKNK
uniref:Ras suppressor protein 1 n=1 Tax=Taeniopygia guttata TaxID=59729 RepID=A0A674GTQ4_TAEGU